MKRKRAVHGADQCAVVAGPSKLPELGKGLGKTAKSFQTAAKVRVAQTATTTCTVFTTITTTERLCA